MTDKIETKEIIKEKIKDPKRVSAGKKGAEAKKLKAELRRKEAELLKKENMELKNTKQITKDDDDEIIKDYNDNDEIKIKVYKNYLPLCAIIAGLG